MHLHICQAIKDKVNYFLSKFPNEEWSGPAWYLAKETDEHDFPIKFEILDFHPLDLGSSVHTEWDSDDFAKILKKKYKTNEQLKQCYIGLLHSHHSMGAYFSGTDTETLEEMAPEKGFYPSLVVSTKVGKEFAFALSYKDQYNKISVIEGDASTDKVKLKANKEWIEIADTIKKNKKPAVTTYRPRYEYGYGYGYGQEEIWDKTDVSKLSDEDLQKGKDLWSKYRNPQNAMDYGTMTKEMKKLGIENPYGVFSGTGWTY